MATNITGLAATQFATTFMNTRIKSAIPKLYSNFFIKTFVQNDQSFAADVERTFTKGEVANISVRPYMTEATNSTNIADNIVYDTPTYGNIPITLDYITYKAWTFRDINLAISDANVAQDYFDVAAQSIARKIERSIITRLRTAPSIAAGNVIGTIGTALNSAVFRRLRTKATLFGVPSDTIINVVVEANAYEALATIPEFANAKGNAVGNVQGQDNTLTGGEFFVGGFYNMRFISSNYYDITTPATDPVATAFIDDCFVTPFRQLAMSDMNNQSIARYNNISMLYTQSYDASKVGGLIVNGKLEVLWGAKEYSGDVNSSGVIQNVPIFNILGGN